MKIYTKNPPRNPPRFSGRCTLFLGAMLTVTAMAAPVAVAYVSPAPVPLGTAANFAILAKAGISTTGTTSIVGDIGVSPAAASYITGFALVAPPTTFTTSPLVTGKVYAADYDPPTPINMGIAIGDMETAYTAAASPAPDATELGAGNISGMTLAPGVYKWGTGVLISAAGVTLSGTASDVWIFQIAQNLTVASGAIVTLSGGAQAKNIFWQVAGQVTLGTTVAMKGNILCQTLIEMQTGATLNGRALAQTAVTLDANVVTKPSADITPGVLHHFAIGTISTPQTAGSAFSVTITAQDENNNTVTSFTGTIGFTTTAGTISPATSNAFTNGQLTQNVTVTQSGTGKTITATKSGGSETGTSNTLTINAGQATKLAFGVQPSNTAPSGTITPAVTVRILDANNNLVTSDARNVTLAIAANPGSGTLSGTTTVAASGGVATFSSLSINTTGTGYTLSAASSPVLTAATSSTFDINAGVLHHFAIGAINPSQTAGSAFTVTITAQDANNNTVTSFTGTVGFTTNAGTISPITSNTFTNGQLTQNVTVTQAGTGKTITATKSGGTETGTSNTLTIYEGQATKLAFGVQPSNTAPSGTITPAVTVRILDANNNLVTSDARNVTLAIAANPGSGTLSGTTTVAASFGVATFSNLSINTTGTGYTLSAASSPVLTGATSSTFDINTGVLHHFAIGVINPSQTAGSAFSVTITAQDANNNTVTSFTGTVGLTTNAGTISPTTSNAFTNGQLTQNVTVTQAGTGKTITATKSGGSETGTSNTLTIYAGQATKFVITGNGTQIAGETQYLTITAKDGLGNTAASYTGDKSLIFSGANSSTNPVKAPTVTDKAGLPVAFGSATTITFANGVATVSAGKNGVMTLYNVETANIAATQGIITTTGSDRLTVTVSSAVFVENELVPNEFSLSQNFPNPFNPSTTIQYNLVNAGMVSLKVYNMVGQEVATLVNGHQEVGHYTLTFNANEGITSLSNGVYFYRLEAGSFVSMKKFVFMK